MFIPIPQAVECHLGIGAIYEYLCGLNRVPNQSVTLISTSVWDHARALATFQKALQNIVTFDKFV